MSHYTSQYIYIHAVICIYLPHETVRVYSKHIFNYWSPYEKRIWKDQWNMRELWSQVENPWNPNMQHSFISSNVFTELLHLVPHITLGQLLLLPPPPESLHISQTISHLCFTHANAILTTPKFPVTLFQYWHTMLTCFLHFFGIFLTAWPAFYHGLYNHYIPVLFKNSPSMPRVTVVS